MKTILTYGTFDLLHQGHLNILRRARSLGDRLVVGVSTDDFNAMKKKKSILPFEQRKNILEELRCVDLVIPEHDWDQKSTDIKEHSASQLVMGDDWTGKFDALSSLCDVTYLPRTEGISSTEIKRALRALSIERFRELEEAISLASQIMSTIQ